MLLAMVQFTHIMDFMIMMPLGPQLMRLFEITPRQFGFLVSAYTFTAGISGFAGAFFVDRFDRKSVLLVAYMGFTLGTLACALAPNYEFLMAARSLAGAFGGVLGAMILSAVGDAISHEKRGRAMGIVMASFSLASVFGVPFGLYLANLFSWHAPFVFVGAAAAVNTLLLLFYMPSMGAHKVNGREFPSPIAILQTIATDKNQITALGLTIFLTFSQFLLIPFLSPSMVANVGFLESDLPYIYFVGGGLTIFTSPLVGRLADRFGKHRVFLITSLFVILPVWLTTHMGPTPIASALVVTALFFVLGNGRFVTSTAMVTAAVQPASRGSFMSINSSVQSLASGSAALISGFIVATGPNGRLLHYDRVGYLSLALTLAAMAVATRLRAVDV